MRMMCEAIQAVTVEFFGVALVVTLLVGCGSLGYRATGWGASEIAPEISGPRYSLVRDGASADHYFGHSYVLASRQP